MQRVQRGKAAAVITHSPTIQLMESTSCELTLPPFRYEPPLSSFVQVAAVQIKARHSGPPRKPQRLL